MTSISSGVSYTPQSPMNRLQNFLQSEVSSGAVPAADASALSSAITDIGNAFQSSQSSSSSPSTTQAASPTSMKDKIDNAIDQEVQSGKLTQDQATELKKVFSDAQQAMGKMGKAGGHHHHASSSTDGDADPTATGTGTSSSSTTASASDPLSVLTNFLQTLETAAKGNAVYDASASQSSGLQSVLLNTQA